MPTLKTASDDELRAELKRREEERVAAAQRAHDAHGAMLRTVLTRQLVDALRPEHDRTSCSDTNLSNGWDTMDERSGRTMPRCVRCALLETAEHSYDPVAPIYVTLALTRG